MNQQKLKLKSEITLNLYKFLNLPIKVINNKNIDLIEINGEKKIYLLILIFRLISAVVPFLLS